MESSKNTKHPWRLVILIACIIGAFILLVAFSVSDFGASKQQATREGSPAVSAAAPVQRVDSKADTETAASTNEQERPPPEFEDTPLLPSNESVEASSKAFPKQLESVDFSSKAFPKQLESVDFSSKAFPMQPKSVDAHANVKEAVDSKPKPLGDPPEIPYFDTSLSKSPKHQTEHACKVEEFTRKDWVSLLQSYHLRHMAASKDEPIEAHNFDALAKMIVAKQDANGVTFHEFILEYLCRVGYTKQVEEIIGKYSNKAINFHCESVPVPKLLKILQDRKLFKVNDSIAKALIANPFISENTLLSGLGLHKRDTYREEFHYSLATWEMFLAARVQLYKATMDEKLRLLKESSESNLAVIRSSIRNSILRFNSSDGMEIDYDSDKLEMIDYTFELFNQNYTEHLRFVCNSKHFCAQFCEYAKNKCKSLYPM